MPDPIAFFTNVIASMAANGIGAAIKWLTSRASSRVVFKADDYITFIKANTPETTPEAYEEVAGYLVENETYFFALLGKLISPVQESQVVAAESLLALLGSFSRQGRLLALHVFCLSFLYFGRQLQIAGLDARSVDDAILRTTREIVESRISSSTLDELSVQDRARFLNLFSTQWQAIITEFPRGDVQIVLQPRGQSAPIQLEIRGADAAGRMDRAIKRGDDLVFRPDEVKLDFEGRKFLGNAFEGLGLRIRQHPEKLDWPLLIRASDGTRTYSAILSVERRRGTEAAKLTFTPSCPGFALTLRVAPTETPWGNIDWKINLAKLPVSALGMNLAGIALVCADAGGILELFKYDDPSNPELLHRTTERQMTTEIQPEHKEMLAYFVDLCFLEQELNLGIGLPDTLSRAEIELARDLALYYGKRKAAFPSGRLYASFDREEFAPKAEDEEETIARMATEEAQFTQIYFGGKGPVGNKEVEVPDLEVVIGPVMLALKAEELRSHLRGKGELRLPFVSSEKTTISVRDIDLNARGIQRPSGD